VTVDKQTGSDRIVMFSETRLNPWICVAVFIIAFILRFGMIETISPFTGDEGMHSVSAVNYTERGYFGPDNWYSPPLKHILMYTSMRMFGDNIYGWRMRNVIFGAASAVMLFILVQKLFSSFFVSAASAGLLILDPLHIMFSRTTFEDIPAVFFMLTALYFTVSAWRKDRERDWIFSGIFFGLSISMRWYCIVVLIISMLVSVIGTFRRGNPSGLIKPLTHLSILPVIVYLLVFIPWFLKGYSLPEWALMQSDALREMRSLSASSFHPALNELRAPEKWFISHIAAGFNLGNGAGRAAYLVIMNNLPVWLFILPAILHMLAAGLKERDTSLLIVSLSFVLLYLPMLMAGRPIFLYTALSLLPFGFTAAAWSLNRLLKRKAYFLLIPLALWCLLLYPLVSGIAVPEIYKPMLHYVTILKNL
jgi:dolichyl-phosphate-mannose--protein O-mannosyl transferase